MYTIVYPLNPFPTNDALRCHETFSFMMSHPAMSLGDRFCDSRKGGTGGGGWVLGLRKSNIAHYSILLFLKNLFFLEKNSSQDSHLLFSMKNQTVRPSSGNSFTRCVGEIECDLVKT